MQEAPGSALLHAGEKVHRETDLWLLSVGNQAFGAIPAL